MDPIVSEFTIDFNDPNFEELVIDKIREYGVCVIENTINGPDIQNIREQLINDILKINPIDISNLNNIKKNWISSNFAPQIREGLFKMHYNNLQQVWNCRRHPNIYRAFRSVYSSLRSEYINKFFISPDGINIRPNVLGPFLPDNKLSDYAKDWAHLDSTKKSNKYNCVQGQVVLNNSTAAFRCSPRSHLVYDNILDFFNIPHNYSTNWLKFPNKSPSDLENIEIIKKMIEEVNGVYQIPIYAKEGSLILWLSSTVHSAKPFTDYVIPTKGQLLQNPYEGWRMVVYVCYRPYFELSYDEDKRKETVIKNLSTNHYGDIINTKIENIKTYHNNIQAIINNPAKVYEITNWHPPSDICIIDQL